MRVLVVEDEPDLLQGLARALRDEGYAVDMAPDGEEGLYKAETWEYDAVVLDVMLPKLNGWEVLRRLRQSRATPVLMLTARDGFADRVKGLDGGADDYVVKPFDLAELFARLRALIRRSLRRATSRMEAGDIVLDLPSKTVTRAGEPVLLTAREYSLFEFLMLHRGEVVSRTVLFDHLFNEEEMSLSNLLDVHVSNLRKKLGHELITTRRGQGYCVE